MSIDLPQLDSVTLGGYAFFFASNLTITNLPSLQSLQTGVRTFTYVNSLIISGFPQLETVSFGDFSFLMASQLSLSSKSLVMYFYKDLPKLSILRTGGFHYASSLSLSNLPELSSFTAGYEAFLHATSFTLSSRFVISLIHSIFLNFFLSQLMMSLSIQFQPLPYQIYLNFVHSHLVMLPSI